MLKGKGKKKYFSWTTQNEKCCILREEGSRGDKMAAPVGSDRLTRQHLLFVNTNFLL